MFGTGDRMSFRLTPLEYLLIVLVAIYAASNLLTP
jgi:hypothetical protein